MENKAYISCILNIYGYSVFFSYELSQLEFDELIKNDKFIVTVKNKYVTVLDFLGKFNGDDYDAINLTKYIPNIYDSLMNELINSDIYCVAGNCKLSYDSRFLLAGNNLGDLEDIKRRIKIEKIKDILNENPPRGCDY